MSRHSFLILLTNVLGVFYSSMVLGQTLAGADKTSGYLALGDSIAFGYNPSVPVSLDNYTGYPRLAGRSVHQKVVNASCFGETSGSMITATAPDLGCHDWKNAGNPMYVSYGGTQIDYAVNYLRTNPAPKLITINIGGNDLGLLQAKCTGPDGVLNPICALTGLPGTLATVGQNLTTIYTRIRKDGGYSGPIVALNYPAFNYADPLLTPAFVALNQVISTVTIAFRGTVADSFGLFLKASATSGGDACKAGLYLRTSATTCDTHPSAAGQDLLTDAIEAAAPDLLK
jgi:lysophospholipase L1-like esterase